MHQHIIKRLKEDNSKEDIDELYKNYISRYFKINKDVEE